MKFLRFGVLVVLSGCSTVEYRYVPVLPPVVRPPVVSVPEGAPPRPAGELLPPSGSSPFKG